MHSCKVQPVNDPKTTDKSRNWWWVAYWQHSNMEIRFIFTKIEICDNSKLDPPYGLLRRRFCVFHVYSKRTRNQHVGRADCLFNTENRFDESLLSSARRYTFRESYAAVWPLLSKKYKTTSQCCVLIYYFNDMSFCCHFVIID